MCNNLISLTLTTAQISPNINFTVVEFVTLVDTVDIIGDGGSCECIVIRH
jgi:hypothetical protein